MIARNVRTMGAALLLAALILVPRGQGDVIQTRDGRTIEGEIVEETPAGYRIKVALGVIEVPRSRIVHVVRGARELGEFEVRWSQIGADDAPAWLALGDWAREQGLKRESERAYREVIRIDPEHEAARLALGYRRVEGRWRTEHEIRSLESMRTEEARKAEELMLQQTGKVLYEGRWVTPEEKSNLERGLVLHEGTWVTAEAKANLEKGLVEFQGQWITPEEKARREKATATPGQPAAAVPGDVPPEFAQMLAGGRRSDHFILVTSVEETAAEGHLKELESAYSYLKAFFHDIEPPAGQPLVIQLLENRDAYNQAAGVADEHSSVFGCFAVEQPVAFGVVAGSDGPEWTKLHLFHTAAHLYGSAVLSPDTPRWFREGIASHAERWFNDQSVSWSKGSMRRYPLLATPDLLDSFTQVTDANVLQAGLMVTMLRTKDNYKELWDTLLTAALDREGSKVERTFFKALRKAKELDQDLATYVQE